MAHIAHGRDVDRLGTPLELENQHLNGEDGELRGDFHRVTLLFTGEVEGRFPPRGIYVVGHWLMLAVISYLLGSCG